MASPSGTPTGPKTGAGSGTIRGSRSVGLGGGWVQRRRANPTHFWFSRSISSPELRARRRHRCDLGATCVEDRSGDSTGHVGMCGPRALESMEQWLLHVGVDTQTRTLAPEVNHPETYDWSIGRKGPTPPAPRTGRASTRRPTHTLAPGHRPTTRDLPPGDSDRHTPSTESYLRHWVLVQKSVPNPRRPTPSVREPYGGLPLSFRVEMLPSLQGSCPCFATKPRLMLRGTLQSFFCQPMSSSRRGRGAGARGSFYLLKEERSLPPP